MHAGEQRSHTTALGLSYLLALPTAWVPGAGVPGAGWPLVIYLHGAGESGSDPRDLLSEGATGTPPMLAARPSGLGKDFIVASPQTNMGWTSADSALQVRGLLDELLQRSSLQVAALALCSRSAAPVRKMSPRARLSSRRSLYSPLPSINGAGCFTHLARIHFPCL